MERKKVTQNQFQKIYMKLINKKQNETININ